MSTPLPEAQYLEVIDRAKLVSIDLIIENPSGDILLGYRKNKPAQNSWFVPGGAIRKSEAVMQAYSRICQNELGVIPENPTFHSLAQHHYTDNFAAKEGIETSYVVLGYRAILNTKVKPDQQHEELKWWNKKVLLHSSEVHPYTKAHFQQEAPPEVLLFKTS